MPFPRPPLRLILLAACCLLPAAIKLWRYPDYPGSDDAFIHLAVVQNLVIGHGWGVNSGEPVFLSTSPLFTVFFAALARLTSRVLETGMALSLAAGSLYVLGVFVLARRVAGRWVPALGCAFLAAANPHLWRWNGTFMEVIPATCAAVWLVWLFHRIAAVPGDGAPRAWAGLGLLLGLGVLLRPELGLLAPAFALHAALNDRTRLPQRLAALAAGLAAVLLPCAFAAWRYFGAALPTTFAAKTAAGLLWINPTVWRQAALAAGSGAIGTAIACLLFLPACRGFPAVLRSAAVLWAVPLAAFLFYSLKTPGLQSAARYFLPFMGVLPVLPAALLAATPPLAAPRHARVLLLACAAQLAFAVAFNETRVVPVLARMTTQYIPAMTAAAAELDRRAMPTEPVFVHADIGVVATARRPDVRLVDGGCLASPELRGLPLPDKLRRARPRLVLESLGTDERVVERAIAAAGRQGRLVWRRAFASHGVEHAGLTYEARLYEVEPAAP
jgi:hypothetical protein